MNDWNTERVRDLEPAPATTVHLLRHGKVHNPGDILYGRLPGYHLSASGRAMARGIADYFADGGPTGMADGGPTGMADGGPTGIGYLAASGLDRAQETAAPLAAVTGLPVVTDDRLIEAANLFEGGRFTAATLRHPRNWGRVRNPARPSWGEPYLDIARRMLAAVYAAEQSARGRVAVLVSHQLPIWTLRRFLSGHRLWHHPARRECALASLTTIRFVDGVISSIGYHEPVAHIVGENDGGAGA